MQGKRILITGGAGLIGSHIADLVAQQAPAEIIIFDNFVRGRRENLAHAQSITPLTIIDGDIRDAQLLTKTMDGVHLVFHQAAIRITQCAEEPRLAHDVLATGTFNVLEAAVEAGVEKVVAASSASVLGAADIFPTDETHHPYNNRTIYGAAKAYNEGLLRSFNEMHGLKYVALRYFNVYGPRMDVYGAYTEVLIRWMERIAEGLPPIVMGDGKQTMDFVHVADIARANVLAAASDESDAVFNVASGAETGLGDLATALLSIMGSSLEPIHQPARKVNPVPRRLAVTENAERALGFKAEISMEQGLRDLVAWWKAERQTERDNVA
ncbi:NAD-dependent epimerase/dehydratase family protein [Devosia algicola]|uniref:NAD-dependent epimerase/dehydratase family protein n=1 Tax=Devosia algicola TaxID=3026418 RepID=A0ABY7YTV3_9HYPH|nr:NAD-dependent epimerase/dehydratase family protein [Devosia algicola]WDR04389.1 NAD-dependent epimerase/dehydratase family protein [Devosia algicola]